MVGRGQTPTWSNTQWRNLHCTTAPSIALRRIVAAALNVRTHGRFHCVTLSQLCGLPLQPQSGWHTLLKSLLCSGHLPQITLLIVHNAHGASGTRPLARLLHTLSRSGLGTYTQTGGLTESYDAVCTESANCAARGALLSPIPTSRPVSLKVRRTADPLAAALDT